MKLRCSNNRRTHNRKGRCGGHPTPTERKPNSISLMRAWISVLEKPKPNRILFHHLAKVDPPQILLRDPTFLMPGIDIASLAVARHDIYNGPRLDLRDGSGTSAGRRELKEQAFLHPRRDNGSAASADESRRHPSGTAVAITDLAPIFEFCKDFDGKPGPAENPGYLIVCPGSDTGVHFACLQADKAGNGQTGHPSGLLAWIFLGGCGCYRRCS